MFILAEIALQRVLQTGIKNLKQNPDVIDDIFATYCQDELDSDFGSDYIAKIRNWFTETKVPVLLAWSLNPERIPCVSIHLSSDIEDEGKAALDDFFGDDEDGELKTGVFTTQIDVGIHANRATDEVLWLYYIVSYVLFKERRLAEKLGLKLHTYSASDYSRDASKMPDQVWSRYIRLRCTVENFWQDGEAITPDLELEVELDRKIQSS